MVRHQKKILLLIIAAMAGSAWMKYHRMSDAEKQLWKQKWNTWLSGKWQQMLTWFQ